MDTEKNKKKKAVAKVQGAAVPLKWDIPENIITRFASNMVIQLLENEFRILFFEINPDIKISLENKIPDEVQANCVASIIINAEKLPAFIDALQRQHDLYKRIKSTIPSQISSSET